MQANASVILFATRVASRNSVTFFGNFIKNSPAILSNEISFIDVGIIYTGHIRILVMIPIPLENENKSRMWSIYRLCTLCYLLYDHLDCEIMLETVITMQ